MSLQTYIQQRDKRIRDAMAKELRTMLEETRQHQASISTTWKNKPDWRVMLIRGDKLMDAKLVGANAAIFRYIDRGTGKYGPKRRPYFIFPRFAPMLKFQTGYVPRTQPIAKFNVGPGKAFGAWVTTSVVLHPGIRAREFTADYVRTVLRPVFQQRILEAIQRVR